MVRRRTRGPLTVRTRLVVGLLALLVALIAGVGAAEVVILRNVLYQRSAQALRTEVQLVVADASTGPSRPSLTGPAGPGRVTTACSALGSVTAGPKGHGTKGPTLGTQGATVLAGVLAQRGIASAVVGPGGGVLACATTAETGTARTFTVPEAAAADLVTSHGAGSGYMTLHAEGRHLLAVAQPVGSDTVLLVTDLGDDDAAVATVLLVTVIGGLVALVVAALASRPLLRSGLAPLRKVARTADAIAAGSLDQRADLARSGDEVGRLGSAFDAMVDRLQDSLDQRDDLVSQLAAREATMRRFLADASHELRTPLTAIRGGAQVLRLGAASKPAELEESLAHIQAQAERMSRLVADLLLLSRSDDPGRVAVVEPLDLGALITAERVHWTAVCAGHPVTIHVEEAWVRGDRDALIRMAANLVDNAGKYSPPGAPVDVSVLVVGNEAELAVTDRGPGIGAADRERVFERFYRGDPARSRTTGGSGLGLAIVAAIAADHGGEVGVAGAPDGAGARLVVRLPLARPASSGADPKVAAPEGTVTGVPALDPSGAAPP